MKNFLLVTLVGAIAVLVFDTGGALLAENIGFDYTSLSIGSSIIYIFFGFLGGRKSGWHYGLFVGAVLGLVDSTLGWMISWTIGPGKPSEEMSTVLIVFTIVFVTLTAAFHGVIGGVLSLLGRK